MSEQLIPFTPAELVFIGIYLASLVVIGLVGYRARRENSLRDFYLAGNGIGFRRAAADALFDTVQRQYAVRLYRQDLSRGICLDGLHSLHDVDRRLLLVAGAQVVSPGEAARLHHAHGLYRASLSFAGAQLSRLGADDRRDRQLSARSADGHGKRRRRTDDHRARGARMPAASSSWR